MSAAVVDFAPRLRLTARGRSVFTALAAAPLVIMALVFALNGGGAIATSSGSSVPLETVTVYSGQSLWQIAEEYAPTSDPRDFIAEVQALNGIGSTLTAGQILQIPAHYSN